MKTVLWLVLNDLRRDWKRPWATLLFAALPLGLSLLIGAVFGGRGSSGPMPTVHVAVLDEDKDMLSGILRSLPLQGEGARNLRLHFVESRAEGLRLVEKSEVSALVVLPAHMTEDLLQGRTNALELFENPAQQVLPRVVRQGASLLALGLSSTAETLGDPLRNIRSLFQRDAFPAEGAVGQVASSSVQHLGHLRSYVFPPLIQFTNVAAADFTPYPTPAPAGAPTP